MLLTWWQWLTGQTADLGTVSRHTLDTFYREGPFDYRAVRRRYYRDC